MHPRKAFTPRDGGGNGHLSDGDQVGVFDRGTVSADLVVVEFDFFNTELHFLCFDLNACFVEAFDQHLKKLEELFHCVGACGDVVCV